MCRWQVAGIAIVFVLLTAGCTGDEKCQSEAGDVRCSTVESDTDSVDAGKEPDTSSLDGGDEDGTDGSDACTPSIVECTADMCGEVNDGCGNTLECGKCPCEDGERVVVSRTCGTCDLGKLTCAEGETGFGSCNSPQIPGVDPDGEAGRGGPAERREACEDKLVFVSKWSSRPEPDGTWMNPFRRYSDAVEYASAGQTIILIGDDAYREELVIKEGVSVLGGFGPASQGAWYDEGGRARIEVPAPEQSDVIGIKAEDVEDTTIVSQIDLVTEDAAEGATNYGAVLTDASGLVLRDVRVQAGAGGDGSHGDDGWRGHDGFNGADGTAGEARYEGLGVFAGDGVGYYCERAQAGRGGRGAARTPYTGQITPATDGTGVGGGSAGQPGPDNDARRGKDGADGQPSSDGMSGAGGLAGGDVVDDVWVSAGRGEDGQVGQDGQGGSGGGGAYFATAPFWMGAGGAGGGSGGCAGYGGAAGEPGGASFGLWLVRSAPTLTNAVFQAGRGGDGGSGGTGGWGGRGGDGGTGTDATVKWSQISESWVAAVLPYTSGDGGDGADGGDGGHGGGGAGGDSFGVHCWEANLGEEDATFVAGLPGRGGRSAGNAGEEGRAARSYGCE